MVVVFTYASVVYKVGTGFEVVGSAKLPSGLLIQIFPSFCLLKFLRIYLACENIKVEAYYS